MITEVMGQFISIEDTILEKECKNPFKHDSSINMSITHQMWYAISFIGRYSRQIEESEYFLAPVNASVIAFGRYLESGVLDDCLKRFRVCWGVDMNDKERVYGTCKIDNPDFFNTMLNEKGCTPQDIFNLAFNFYIQSFIDSYNGRNQEFGILFEDRKTARKNAMKAGDQSLIEILNNVKYIRGFTKEGIIIKED
jgi:hypothetical protein